MAGVGVKPVYKGISTVGRAKTVIDAACIDGRYGEDEAWSSGCAAPALRREARMLAKGVVRGGTTLLLRTTSTLTANDEKDETEEAAKAAKDDNDNEVDADAAREKLETRLPPCREEDTEDAITASLEIPD